MNKDTVVASAIGFGLGLVVALILWIGPKVLKNPTPSQTPTLGTQEESAKTALTITTPVDEEIVKDKKVAVEGNAGKRSTVVVTSPLDEIVIESKDDGSFRTAISLEEGENEITIVPYSTTGDVIDSKTLSVIYNSQEL